MNEAKLPPGPQGRWGTTLRLIRDPRRAFAEWIRRYGDPFLIHALNGWVVITGRPDLIKQIYGADPAVFRPFAVDTVAPIIGSGSMLLLSGDEHRRERRLVMPMFHGDRMKAYGQAMQQAALEVLAPHRTGRPFAALRVTTQISLEVIVRTVFGGEDVALRNRLRDASRELVARSSPLIFFSQRMQFRCCGLSPWDRYLRARRDLDMVFDQAMQSGIGGSAGTDILSMLMAAQYEDGTAMTPAHIRDELLTFMFAGHETSALAMAWALYHLHRHPQVLQRLKVELATVDPLDSQGLAQLPYLKAVVQETLRLHPIITEVVRLLAAPLQLGEYVIPAGYAVAPAAGIAHYDANIYETPDEFRPERFLERSYSPFEFMPFGGGHRRCIGAAFASYEMAIVLGTLLGRYELELLERRPVVPKRRNVTMGPSREIKMRILSA